MNKNNNGDKKVLIDGKEVAPINKHKLPPTVDWQAKIREKQAAAKQAAAKQAAAKQAAAKKTP